MSRVKLQIPARTATVRGAKTESPLNLEKEMWDGKTLNRFGLEHVIPDHWKK